MQKIELNHINKTFNGPTSKAFAKEFARNACSEKLRLTRKVSDNFLWTQDLRIISLCLFTVIDMQHVPIQTNFHKIWIFNPFLAQCCILYRNQSFDLQYNTNGWFLWNATVGWNWLTHFWPMCLFYTPWKHQKTFLPGIQNMNIIQKWFKLYQKLQ